MFVALVALSALGLPQTAVSGSLPSTAAPVPAVPVRVDVAPEAPRVAKGTVVAIRIGKGLSSKLSRPGERFPITLSETFSPTGAIILPAGIVGEGEVVHAAKPRWGGKAGELIVNARFLTCGETRIPLGKMKVGGAGESRTTSALVAGMVFTPLMFAVNGGDIVIPEGASFVATVTADTDLPGNAGCIPPIAAVPISPVSAAQSVQPASTQPIGDMPLSKGSK
jgi:hypothetical protein